MARIVKEYTERRNEILDTAQQFIYSKGFELMTIQDLLDTLGISKGAFYYYFDSKHALLEALIERMLAVVLAVTEPILQDENLSTIDKFNRFIAASAGWKTARKDILIPLLRTWYTDDNAIVRQKLTARGNEIAIPILSGIIRQGVREGVMDTPYPEQAGEAAYALMNRLGDKIAEMIFSDTHSQDDFQNMVTVVAAYTDAIERTLGIRSGSLTIFDPQLLKQWV